MIVSRQVGIYWLQSMYMYIYSAVTLTLCTLLMLYYLKPYSSDTCIYLRDAYIHASNDFI